MTLDYMAEKDYPGGRNVGAPFAAGLSQREILNKLIELSKSWHAPMAAPFTTAGAGAWEDTLLEQVTDKLLDGVQINAVAHLQFESPGTAAAVITARIIIAADTGEEFIVEVPTAITDKMNMSVSHSFTGVAGTAYTVKLQVKDDATTAMTVGIATMDVTLGSVRA